MAAYKTVPKTFLLLTHSICVSALLICSHPNYLGSFGRLMCSGGLIRHTYTDPSGLDVVECALSGGGLCNPESVPVAVINNTHTVLNITHIKTTDAGEWSCSIGINAADKCVLTVVKTPECNITSKQATDVLVQYQELTLTVDVRDYFCSNTTNVSLQTGNVTTLLMEADSVPSVSHNTTSVTLNVTDSHLGTTGLVFRCLNDEWNIECGGVTKLVTPTCRITSKQDTDVLVLYQELTLTVAVCDFNCSVDSNFTLQTGDVKQPLNSSDQGLPPVTFKVTEAHLGGVRLVFNCQDKHWNLTCDDVTELNNKMKQHGDVATASTIIIAAVVAGLVVIVVIVVIIIVFVAKRKVNRIKPWSSVKPCSPPYITVGEPGSTAYATVEVNNLKPPVSGPGGSQDVVAIDAGGYASVGDVVANAHTSQRGEPEESSASAAPTDSPKKEIGVIVQKIVPQDDKTCINELYAAVKKTKDPTWESDTAI